jgi:hypothetical protein
MSLDFQKEFEFDKEKAIYLSKVKDGILDKTAYDGMKKTVLAESKLTLFESIYFKVVQNLSVNIFKKYCEGEVEGLENLKSLDGGYLRSSPLVSGHN